MSALLGSVEHKCLDWCHARKDEQNEAGTELSAVESYVELEVVGFQFCDAPMVQDIASQNKDCKHKALKKKKRAYDMSELRSERRILPEM